MLGIPPKVPRVCGGGGEDESRKKDDKDRHRQLIQRKYGAKPQREEAPRNSSSASIMDTYEATPPTYSTKIGLVHVASNKPVYDDEYYENLASERMIQELIEYLQNAWNVHIERKSSLIDITFRTMDMMHHKKPADHWFTKRARDKVSDYTGFFSNVRKSYQALGAPKLDTPTLIFENMPKELRIDGMQWFLDLEKREEEESRRNAPLPKAPRQKIKRTKYGRGRIRRGAGGTEAVDKFVHTALTFQREIRGSMTFTKLLEKWKQSKDDEAANRGSPFGVFRHRGQADSMSMSVSGGADRKADVPKASLQKRNSSTIDDRIYQHQMLHLEKMMTAMYDIIKSLLNMKPRHVRSQYKLPQTVVMSLREHSPENRLRSKVIPPQIMDRAKGKNASVYRSTINTAANRKSGGSISMAPAMLSATALLEFKSKDAMPVPSSAKSKGKLRGTGHVVPTKFEEEDVNDILPLYNVCDKTERKENLDWIRSVLNSPSYLDDRPPELKLDKLQKEIPEDMVKRVARNDHRYEVFFDRRNLHTPIPQWHDVKLEASDLGYTARSIPGRSLGEFAMLEFAGKNENDLPFTTARPNPDDVPSPRLPNAQSVEVIDADEQSRLNLLAKCPGADATGPLPQDVQRLYHEAGIKTTTKDMYRTVMKIKRAFNESERKVRAYYLNEIEKIEWNTLKRYKTNVAAIEPAPVFEWSIAAIRHAKSYPVSAVPEEEQVDESGFRRPSVWYKQLMEKCRDVGAIKHHGCKAILMRLHKYCDVDIKTRPNLLNRFCLLVLSLPTTELGTPFFQEAILFLLDRLFGSPKELFYQWLRTRGLPCLM